MNHNIKFTEDCMRADKPLVDWSDDRFADCDYPVVIQYTDRGDATVQKNNLIVQQEILGNTGRMVRCDSISPCARKGTPYTVFARVEVVAEMVVQLPFFDNFFMAYQMAAILSEKDDTGAPLGCNYLGADFCAESEKLMRFSCATFIAQNFSLLQGAVWHSGYDWSQAGNDFWLTRNKHGIGFQDRGLRDVGDMLSESARIFGRSHIKSGDCLVVIDEMPVKERVSCSF